MRILLILYTLFFVNEHSFAFQTYGGEQFGNPQIDPEIKEFKYYISPTYWDILSGQEKPITNFLVESTKHAFRIIENDMSAVGLKFEFSGFKDIETLQNKSSGSEFISTIYVDFSSRIFSFSENEFGGRAYTKKLNIGDQYSIGGIVHYNGKKINLHHPRGENYRTIIHEALHILGVGHSTNPSSQMAYTETWQPRFSTDDLLAVSSIYKSTGGASPGVYLTLNGNPAGGVETVWISKDDGRSQTAITDSNGYVKIYGLDPGEYYIGARELTPTGPCFTSPTKGFISSFYISESSSTNDLSDATVVRIDQSDTSDYYLKLIPGTKKFDCHYVYGFWCNNQSDCSSSRAVPGASGRANVLNDLSTTHHNTETDMNSGVHSSIVVESIGDISPFTIGAAILGDGNLAESIGYNLENYTAFDFSIASGAQQGTYAALCKAGGETALMSSFIEVMDTVGYFDNKRIFPDYLNEMSPDSAPINSAELGSREPPSKPKKFFGMACGSISIKYKDESKNFGGLVMLMIVLFPVSFFRFKSNTFFLIFVTGSLMFAFQNKAEAIELYTGAWVENLSEKSTDTATTTKYRVALQPMQGIGTMFSLGGKFLYYSESFKTSATKQTTTFASFGPSLGFAPQPYGFAMTATYLMLPTRTTKGLTETTEHGGSGMSFDFGYKVQIASLAIGPVLSYTTTNYKKETGESYEQDISRTNDSILGYFGVWWKY